MSVLLPLLVSRTNDMEKCLMSTGSDREKYVLFYSCVSIGKSFAHVRYTLAVNSNLILLTYANPLQYCFQLSPNACKTFKSKEFLVLNFGLVGSGQVKKYGPVDNSGVGGRFAQMGGFSPAYSYI